MVVSGNVVVYFCEQVIAIRNMDLVFSLKAFRCDLSAGVGVGVGGAGEVSNGLADD